MSVSAVKTTGIYCRPGCPARPNADNVTQYDHPAAAEAAGFRACHRCRPYRGESGPGAVGPDLVCRAVRMVTDGALDDASEAELAARVGVSPRHLRRLFEEHVGVTPDGLARSRRVHFARRLLDDTDLGIADIAFASGFGSTRQFQRAATEVFGASPSRLRERRRSGDRLAADGGLDLRLWHRGPLDWDATLAWLASRAVAGVEIVDGGTYRRTALVGDSPAMIELRRGGDDHLVLRAHLPHWGELLHIVRSARRVAGLDLDLETATVDLSGEQLMASLIERRPGLRTPGAWEPFEVCVRAVLGQQVSVAAARTFASRLTAAFGTPFDGLSTIGLTHLFPDAGELAGVDLGPAGGSGIGLTDSRARTITELAEAVLSGELDLDPLSHRSEADFVEALCAVRGIGPWTAQYAAMRLGAPDAFCAGDVVLRDSAGMLLGTARPGPSELESTAERWRPWRSLAATHLWAAHAERRNPAATTDGIRTRV